MIKEKKPLCLYEVKDMTEDLKESEKVKEIKSYVKKFIKSDSKKSGKLKEELEKLGIIKLKEMDIVKIVDLLPENAVELNKIVTEASLDADETNKILETIKNNK